MDQQTPPIDRQPWPLALAERVGFGLLLLIAFLIPLFFLPVGIYQQFDTDVAETIMGKVVLMQLLAGLALMLGGLIFISKRGVGAYSGHAALPSLLLALFLIWTFASVLASPNVHYSFTWWLWMAFPASAALTGPMYLRTGPRCRAMIVAMVVCGFAVSAIGVATVAGWEGIFEKIYGFLPSKMNIPTQYKMPQGGRMRAGAMSTLANVEYAGSFASAVAAISAVLLFDWAGRSKRPLLWRVVVLGLLGILLLHLALSGSRQPWVALLLAGILRLLMELRVPKMLLAGGFSAFLLVSLFFGLVFGAAVFAAFFCVCLVVSFKRGDAREVLARSSVFNRMLVFGGPALMVALFVAFSVPGPWNPTGMRLYERFGTLSSASDNSTRERLMMFAASSDMLWSDPLLGIGPGLYANRFHQSMARVSQQDRSGAYDYYSKPFALANTEQSHNDYLQIAAESGIPGLVLFLGAIVAVLAGLWRLIRGDNESLRLLSLPVFIGLVAFFSIMLTSFPLYMPSRTALFWMLMATALGLISQTPEAAE